MPLGLWQRHKLLLKLLEQKLLLLELVRLLLLRSLLLLLLFLQELEDCLGGSKIDHVVFIASLISSDLLVRGISPVSVHSELVLIPFRVKELYEIVSWRLLSDFA